MLIQDIGLIAKGARSYINDNQTIMSLTGIQQTVCVHIYLHKNSNQDQLARALMINKGNMARLLAALEQEGFVHREENPNNRRENIVSLTKKGEELIQDVVQLCADWENEVLNGLTPEEINIFKNVCSKIADRQTTERR